MGERLLFSLTSWSGTIIFLDNPLSYTRSLLLVSLAQLFGAGCRFSCCSGQLFAGGRCLGCSCGRESLGKNVSVVIHRIHLFEHFSGSDQLSVADSN